MSALLYMLKKGLQTNESNAIGSSCLRLAFNYGLTPCTYFRPKLKRLKSPQTYFLFDIKNVSMWPESLRTIILLLFF